MPASPYWRTSASGSGKTSIRDCWRPPYRQESSNLRPAILLLPAMPRQATEKATSARQLREDISWELLKMTFNAGINYTSHAKRYLSDIIRLLRNDHIFYGEY